MSIAEEQLTQMVRDFIESESASSEPVVPAHIDLNHHQPTYIDTLQEIIWRAMDIEVEILEKILMYVRNTGSLIEPKDVNKWVVLRLKIDGYEASLCKTSWVSFLGQTKGAYEFVDVMTSGKRVIIDMDFRSQFELARPSSSYKKLIETLPSIFVASEEKLENVVSLLCSAAKESLKESGLLIPPWRKPSYMLPKWFSENCKKFSLSPNSLTTMELGIMGKSDGKCTGTRYDLEELSYGQL
ncbi:hypothetical protein PanWU01x14_037240 [Parasponia andersonii]|uniref:DUF506 family protein n=1 Tax=Parasponia andersonii TaxID=3476 RepID=A0A2P5DSP7_PARAD|nr:hypothetical protein PanWU01x14_037240 [Parasponia andersonii]